MKRYPVPLAASVFLFFIAHAYAQSPTPAAAPDSPSLSTTTLPSEAAAAAPRVQKRFWRATAEMIVVGYSPWLYSHYVLDADYADISMDSVRRNFEEGFVFDQDSFQTNQWGHPFQGSLYFNAGRENGFNFWESSLFTLVGDFGWEFFMESELPSYNDMVNTLFGGMSRGEMTYRLSNVIRDNRATGAERFWREFGAGIVNPVGFVDRLVFGDMWKKKDNPPDRFPNMLFVMVDGGYQHGREMSAHPDQGYFSLILRQNDPHETEIKKPFDYFDLEGTMSLAKGPLLPYVTYRGLLAGWELKDDGDVHHMLAPTLSYNYFNNTASALGGQGLNLTLLSRWKLPEEFDLRTELSAQGFIFAGIQVDYEEDSINATGRNYDFGSGGGPKIDVRIRRHEVDWFKLSMSAGWFNTNDGISSENRLILVDAEARYPLMKDLYAGLGWSFQERRTLYDHLPEVNQANSGIKVFLSWAFRAI